MYHFLLNLVNSKHKGSKKAHFHLYQNNEYGHLFTILKLHIDVTSRMQLPNLKMY